MNHVGYISFIFQSIVHFNDVKQCKTEYFLQHGMINLSIHHFILVKCQLAKITFNYLRQNKNPSINLILTFCEHSSVVNDEQESI